MKNLPFKHPAWIEFDLSQFKQNLAIIRNHIGAAKLCLPVKANAYGHGLVPIACAAVESGVDYLAVSCLQEGALLRDANINIPILVVGAIHEDQIPDLLHYQLEFSLSSLMKAKLVAEKCLSLQKTCRVHVEVDTGMQRTGVRPSTALELLNYVDGMGCFHLAGIYSHFATADNPDNDFAKKQIRVFEHFVSEHIKPIQKDIICHLANSGGVCYYPKSHMDMVRPGLLCFGYFPSCATEKLKAIKPFFTLKAKIAYFKVVAKGKGIGYGHTYETTEDSRIVTIPVGYGDGYRRALSNKAQVLIRGKRYPIVGNVCMDQFMVNVGRDEAYVGDEVVLIGKQGEEEITLTEIANLCDTISYEILCGFNERLPRVY